MSSEEDINTDSSPESPRNSKENYYFEPRPQPKIIRVLTVIAYILSVSMAAILLSIYYIFMWNDQNEFFANDMENATIPHSTCNTFNTSEGFLEKEMQQQIPEIKEDEVLSTSSTTDENTTAPEYEIDFGKTSKFLKRLMYDPYADND